MLAIFLTPTTQLSPFPVCGCVRIDQSQEFVEFEYECNDNILCLCKFKVQTFSEVKFVKVIRPTAAFYELCGH